MSLHDSPVVVVPTENTQQWSTEQPFTTNMTHLSVKSKTHEHWDLGQQGGGLSYQRLGCRNTWLIFRYGDDKPTKKSHRRVEGFSSVQKTPHFQRNDDAYNRKEVFVRC